jgi:drug/metabolite transporter (DMT)-like permease
VTPRRADVLLVAACALWGASFVVVKDALAMATPLTFVAVRFAVAGVALSPFVDLRRPFPRGEVAGGLLLTALLATGFAAQTFGLVYTTPSRSAFIVALSSVLAPAVAFAALRQRPRALVLAALAVAGVGLYYLTAPEGGGLNRGDAWTLVTAVVFAGQIVAVSELTRRYDARRLVWLQIVGTAAVIAIAAPLLETPAIDWNLRLVGAFAYTAVFATVVTFLWQMQAQRHMSSARAALLFCFEPVFAALASWVVLGERLSAAQWLGGGLILAGMVLAELPGMARSARLPADPRRRA